MKSPEELLASFIAYCTISERDAAMIGGMFSSLSTQTSWMDYRRGYWDGVADSVIDRFKHDMEELK